MKKALITGICGQDGSYLAKLLLEKGYSVSGGRRRSSLDDEYRLRVLGIESEVQFLNFDLSDPYNIFAVIEQGQFDEVYNLAAQSFVGASWDFPIQTSNVNAMGPLYLLDAILRTSKHTKFYQASTSEMFGLIQQPIQDEETPFYPRSPYGVAKLFAHTMTVNYRESHDLYACSGILFNHESPLRGNEFVTKKISSQLVEWINGRRKTIKLGNLNAMRDWGYAPDYVMGMWSMLQADAPKDYVLATGRTSTIREFCQWCCDAVNLQIEWHGNGKDEVGIDTNTSKIVFEVDEQFYRPAEVDILLGNPARAKDQLGWAPRTQVEELAQIMVEYELTGKIE